MKIEKTIGIARPLEEVWAFVSDTRNDPQWCVKVDSVEQTEGEGPGSQARHRVLHRPVRFKGAKELTVTVEEYKASSLVKKF
jgi:carbon monoxide dehydrogenase subunit G